MTDIAEVNLAAPPVGDTILVGFQKLNLVIDRINAFGTFNNVTLTGGSINNIPIGNSTPSTGVFTNVTVNSTITLSSATINLADNQISGDKIDGGTISNVAILLSNTTPTLSSHAASKGYVDTSISAITLAGLAPSQTGQAGKALITNGTTISWTAITGFLSDPGSNGLTSRTSSGTVTPRTITAGSSKISIGNGDGVSGNPTVDIAEANLTLSNMIGTLGITHGGTGQTTANAALNALLPSQASAAGKYLTSDGVNTSWGALTSVNTLGDPGGNGIVVRTSLDVTTNVSIAVGSSKLSVSNGNGVAGNPTLDVIEANLTLSNMGGTLGINQGGTGQATANAALNALLPSQGSNANKVLTSDGTNTSWQPGLPSQGGNSGKALTTDGASASWGAFLALSGGTLSGALILSGDPTTGLNPATRQFVEAFPNRINARGASTVALTVTYSNGTFGVGATLTNAGTKAAFAVDGVSGSLNDVFFIKNQSSGFQNGLYKLTTIGDGSTNWVLTRLSTYDGSINTQIAYGNVVYVVEGTTNAAKGWILATTGAIVVGTTALNYISFGYLNVSNNLGDLTDLNAARTNLGLGALATLGSINNANWSGTALSVSNGGTGSTTTSAAFSALCPITTLGDLLYGGTSGVNTRLAGNITNSKKFLQQTGTGSVSAAPQWGTIANTDVSGLGSLSTLSSVNNTNWNGAALTIANGGTGQITANAALNALLPSQTANSGLVLTTDGTNTSWAAPSGFVLISDQNIETLTTASVTWTIGQYESIIVQLVLPAPTMSGHLFRFLNNSAVNSNITNSQGFAYNGSGTTGAFYNPKCTGGNGGWSLAADGRVNNSNGVPTTAIVKFDGINAAVYYPFADFQSWDVSGDFAKGTFIYQAAQSQFNGIQITRASGGSGSFGAAASGARLRVFGLAAN